MMKRQIALSFDDAPRGDGPILSGQERTNLLISNLSAAEVAQVAMFVIAGEFSMAGRRDRVLQYARAGHLIANHSDSHVSLRNVDSDEYLRDIAAADKKLRSIPNFVPYFRYPYLCEGESTEKMIAVRNGLADLGYSNGYITIDDFDWYFDTQVSEHVRVHKRIEFDRLERYFVSTLVDAVEFYDGIALSSLGRSPAHVLLLHETDMCALFILPLVRALRQIGFEIISPAVAYKDPISDMHPDHLFHNNGRVAALAHSFLKVDRSALSGRYESTELLDQRFDATLRGMDPG